MQVNSLEEKTPTRMSQEVRDIVQGTGIKTTPKKKKCKKAKWLPEGALQIAVKRTEVKSKGYLLYLLPFATTSFSLNSGQIGRAHV